MRHDLHHIELLNKILEKKQKTNPQYSLRAFARDLSLDSSGLTKVLKGEIMLSLKAAVLTASKLQLSDLESKRFIDSVVEEHVYQTVQSASLKPACEHFIYK